MAFRGRSFLRELGGLATNTLCPPRSSDPVAVRGCQEHRLCSEGRCLLQGLWAPARVMLPLCKCEACGVVVLSYCCAVSVDPPRGGFMLVPSPLQLFFKLRMKQVHGERVAGVWSLGRDCTVSVASQFSVLLCDQGLW